MENAPQTYAQIHIRIEPVAEEATDMNTLALVNDVHEEALASLPHQAPYTVELLSEHRRDAGLIQFGLLAIGTGLVTNKDLVMNFLQLLQAGINVLSQHRHVKHIQITRKDGSSLSIDNPSLQTETQLINDWLAQGSQLTTTSVIDVTATVSQDEEE